MKKLMKHLVMLSILGLTLSASPLLFAQQWSAEQQEVWKNVEAYWDRAAAGDLEGFMAYFHEDYLGWSYTSGVPGDKATARKWIAEDMKTEKTLVHTIKPVGIKVHGNTAIVHYYWAQRVKNAEGKERNESGRWTDILIKQGSKWVMIGDHGGVGPGN